MTDPAHWYELVRTSIFFGLGWLLASALPDDAMMRLSILAKWIVTQGTSSHLAQTMRMMRDIVVTKKDGPVGSRNSNDTQSARPVTTKIQINRSCFRSAFSASNLASRAAALVADGPLSFCSTRRSICLDLTCGKPGAVFT
jgi:hypothetical protein